MCAYDDRLDRTAAAAIADKKHPGGRPHGLRIWWRDDGCTYYDERRDRISYRPEADRTAALSAITPGSVISSEWLSERSFASYCRHIVGRFAEEDRWSNGDWGGGGDASTSYVVLCGRPSTAPRRRKWHQLGISRRQTCSLICAVRLNQIKWNMALIWVGKPQPSIKLNRLIR